MFISKLNFTVDLEKIRQDVAEILTKTDWGLEQQIGLTYRLGAENKWKDSTGSLYEQNTRIELAKEDDFTEFNSETPEYLTHILTEFCDFQKINLGRARLMRLEPKRGLSVHFDTTERYHLVIHTNQFAYIANTFQQNNSVSAVCFHMPADSSFYKVDTTREHFVYNGGKTERIHLVISPKV